MTFVIPEPYLLPLAIAAGVLVYALIGAITAGLSLRAKFSLVSYPDDGDRALTAALVGFFWPLTTIVFALNLLTTPFVALARHIGGVCQK